VTCDIGAFRRALKSEQTTHPVSGPGLRRSLLGLRFLGCTDQRVLLPREPAQSLLVGHQEQEPQAQRGWFTDHLCRRQVARPRLGKQLAAATRRRFLALHPCLLGRQGHHRRLVDTAGRAACQLSRRDYARSHMIDGPEGVRRSPFMALNGHEMINSAALEGSADTHLGLGRQRLKVHKLNVQISDPSTATSAILCIAARSHRFA
jgi:hypothetical protein